MKKFLLILVAFFALNANVSAESGFGGFGYSSQEVSISSSGNYLYEVVAQLQSQSGVNIQIQRQVDGNIYSMFNSSNYYQNILLPINNFTFTGTLENALNALASQAKITWKRSGSGIIIYTDIFAEQVMINVGGFTTLSNIASTIQGQTGLRYVVDPETYVGALQDIHGYPPNIAKQMAYDNSVPKEALLQIDGFYFSGTLRDALNNLASKAIVSWKWNGKEVVFSRTASQNRTAANGQSAASNEQQENCGPAPAVNPKDDSRVNLLLLCYGPRPCRLCQPFRSIYDSKCEKASGQQIQQAVQSAKCNATKNMSQEERQTVKDRLSTIQMNKPKTPEEIAKEKEQQKQLNNYMSNRGYQDSPFNSNSQTMKSAPTNFSQKTSEAPKGTMNYKAPEITATNSFASSPKDAKAMPLSEETKKKLTASQDPNNVPDITNFRNLNTNTARPATTNTTTNVFK